MTSTTTVTSPEVDVHNVHKKQYNTHTRVDYATHSPVISPLTANISTSSTKDNHSTGNKTDNKIEKEKEEEADMPGSLEEMTLLS